MAHAQEEIVKYLRKITEGRYTNWPLVNALINVAQGLVWRPTYPVKVVVNLPEFIKKTKKINLSVHSHYKHYITANDISNLPEEAIDKILNIIMDFAQAIGLPITVFDPKIEKQPEQWFQKYNFLFIHTFNNNENLNDYHYPYLNLRYDIKWGTIPIEVYNIGVDDKEGKFLVAGLKAFSIRDPKILQQSENEFTNTIFRALLQLFGLKDPNLSSNEHAYGPMIDKESVNFKEFTSIKGMRYEDLCNRAVSVEESSLASNELIVSVKDITHNEKVALRLANPSTPKAIFVFQDILSKIINKDCRLEICIKDNLENSNHCFKEYPINYELKNTPSNICLVGGNASFPQDTNNLVPSTVPVTVDKKDFDKFVPHSTSVPVNQKQELKNPYAVVVRYMEDNLVYLVSTMGLSFLSSLLTSFCKKLIVQIIVDKINRYNFLGRKTSEKALSMACSTLINKYLYTTAWSTVPFISIVANTASFIHHIFEHFGIIEKYPTLKRTFAEFERVFTENIITLFLSEGTVAMLLGMAPSLAGEYVIDKLLETESLQKAAKKLGWFNCQPKYLKSVLRDFKAESHKDFLHYLITKRHDLLLEKNKKGIPYFIVWMQSIIHESKNPNWKGKSIGEFFDTINTYLKLDDRKWTRLFHVYAQILIDVLKTITEENNLKKILSKLFQYGPVLFTVENIQEFIFNAPEENATFIKSFKEILLNNNRDFLSYIETQDEAGEKTSLYHQKYAQYKANPVRQNFDQLVSFIAHCPEGMHISFPETEILPLLFLAVKDNEIDLLRKILSKKNMHTYFKEIPLLDYAIDYGNSEIIQIFLEKIPRDKCKINIQKDVMKVTFTLKDEHNKSYTIEKNYGISHIDPSKLNDFLKSKNEMNYNTLALLLSFKDLADFFDFQEAKAEEKRKQQEEKYLIELKKHQDEERLREEELKYWTEGNFSTLFQDTDERKDSNFSSTVSNKLELGDILVKKFNLKIYEGGYVKLFLDENTFAFIHKSLLKISQTRHGDKLYIMDKLAIMREGKVIHQQDKLEKFKELIERGLITPLNNCTVNVNYEEKIIVINKNVYKCDAKDGDRISSYTAEIESENGGKHSVSIYSKFLFSSEVHDDKPIIYFNTDFYLPENKALKMQGLDINGNSYKK